MGKIQKLPESLIRLIAAGEVIERPASVLKELIENSMDAGATQIAVDLWGAGRTRIRVTDNGEGMSREDAELALDRHATSKLKSFDDLQKLTTFGFRGEALPSIAAVSRLDLTTRVAHGPEAWRLHVEGGKLTATSAVGAPPGTTIDVQDLFFNTPARAKFLKRDSTERSHLLRTVQELAFAHPTVGFQVTADGKTAMTLTSDPDLKRRLSDLWGPALTEQFLPLDIIRGPIQLKGFIHRIPAHQPTKNYQYLFVNGRVVQQRMLTHAVYEAYHEWLPVGRHPMFVLFLDVDPSQVDVNVHPTKREVRFSNERMLYDLLFTSIRDVFKAGSGSVPEFTSQGRRPVVQDFVNSGSIPSGHPGTSLRGSGAPMAPSPMMVAEALTIQAPLIPDSLPLSLRGSLRILGQFQKLFVLVEQGDELLLFDQHAAAERVMFEKLLQQAKTPKAASQRLLTPFIWDLSPDQAVIVQDTLPALEKLGFVLEPFGGHSFALKECPAVFPELKHAKKFLDIFIDSLNEEIHDPHGHAQHEAVARAACRAAIKANDPLSTEEIQHLLHELTACERPMTCPHGRPTHIRLTLSELRRRFGRT